MHTFLLAAALGVAGLSSAALAAEPQDHMPDVQVAYGDLDLTTPQGVKTLDHRLNKAAQDACPSDSGISDIGRISMIRACRTTKRQEIASLRTAVLAQASIRGKAVASAAQ